MEFLTRGCKISMKLSIKLMYFKETAIFCELAKCQVLEIRVYKVNFLCQKSSAFHFIFLLRKKLLLMAILSITRKNESWREAAKKHTTINGAVRLLGT